MALSKSTRIIILLAIDSAFFLLELIVGYGVHSLALVADSFHMLNDVLSLCVGLWAVKVANEKPSSKMYTYGWQRAETLGALVNGVFLVALCLSIFLEAIQRFVEPQKVSNPWLVLIVGSFGLLSNILGLLLFHEHGHSHGAEHEHSHEENAKLAIAEEGQSNTAVDMDSHTATVADETGNVADVLPQNTIAGWPKSKKSPGPPSDIESSTSDAENDEEALIDDDAATEDQPLLGKAKSNGSAFLPQNTIAGWPKSKKSPGPPSGSSKKASQAFTRSDEDASTATVSTAPVSTRKPTSIPSGRHYRNTSGSRSRFGSVDDIQIHPASFHDRIIQAGVQARRMEDIESSTSDAENDEEALIDDDAATEDQPLLDKAKSNGSASYGSAHAKKAKSHGHADHKHNQPQGDSKEGHSHGDLNMRGVFLHVMGDALGNVGVIGSALFIGLTPWSWRYYVDPAVSLIITVIILASAIPLCKAASRILLQAVPPGISVDAIQANIRDLDGVISCHHLHVWQLSDTKKVASLHVQVDFDFKGEGSARYMQIAREIRRCLHAYGIHSSTIQPEFCLDSTHRHTPANQSEDEGADGGSGVHGASKRGSRAASMHSQPDACLLECGDECGEGKQCCVPNGGDSKVNDESRQ
ncbi:MAG: hypothetical protein Q9203_004696 [Teloschistes exilis]